MSLDLNKTYKTILAAARQGHFVTYGELAAASSVDWKDARRPLPRQLGDLVKLGHERGWPLLSAIVVNKEHTDTGTLENGPLKGFLAAAEMVGHEVGDPQAFVKAQQQAVFEWAKTAPDEIEVPETRPGEASPGGPRFVHYFALVLEALRACGGEASPDRVLTWIKEHGGVPVDEIEGLTRGGHSMLESKVGWARFYLAKAGLIDGRRRGTWALTQEGLNATLSHAQALSLFRDVRAQFKAVGDDDEEAPEAVLGETLFADPKRSFWFVGALWNGGDDQSQRFLAKGIWENGYHDKFAAAVRRMKPGDRIAIKSSFTRKTNLPFDTRGKTVSCMRIKAIGTITENLGDGRAVRVDWQPLHPPRDWFFYTYRITVVEADPADDLARRLILFTFAGSEQDYEFWIDKVPYFAKRYGSAATAVEKDDPLELETIEIEEDAETPPSYSLDNICDEGCFLTREELAGIKARVEGKKNLVLQGPPGTGKTWLAKRLAYALIGSKDPKVIRDRLRAVQFHPTLSYEDFVRGWRPSGEGKLDLVDGLFLEIVEAAKAAPDRPFVLVIEEINRGNPAQIFGEMLTLLECSKRSPEEALELAYRREANERVYVPRNLYLIGTMNIADRSLALVDLALRRRFAFVNLEPQFNGLWRAWCTGRCSIPHEAVSLIAARMDALNEDIAQDRSLGSQYRLGHSYVTPPEGAPVDDPRAWFREVVHTEILPLLEEYWFDAPDKAAGAAQRLLEGV